MRGGNQNMLKVYRVFLISLLLLGLLTLSTNIAGAWPERPITIACFAAAGGGTDLVNRTLAGVMEKYLKVPINVVNMTGAQGAEAVNYVWQQKHDGYTWLGHSEGILLMPLNNAFQYTTKVWESFILGGSPELFSVRSDSPYKSMAEVLEAAKTKEIKIGASIPGAIHHMKLMYLVKVTGLKLKYIPYPGSYPSNVACLAGEVDAVMTSLQEQSEFLKAGKLRALAAIEKTALDVPGIGKIPSIVEFVPQFKKIPEIKQFLGFSVPYDVPADVITKIRTAYIYALRTETVKNFVDKNYLILYGLYGTRAKSFIQTLESIFAWLAWEAGIVKESPEKFDIPKPAF
jgi:tripartite-type tricarboxylate transporter receptor subunit TctC